MKENELRVGNMIELYGKEVTVIGIDRTLHGDYHVTYNDGVTDYRVARYLDQFNPIPLTDEWLVKFGFVEVFEHRNHGTIKSFELKAANDSTIISQLRPDEKDLIWVSITDCDYEGYVLTSIDKVHQLQNLYFALTGEELTLK